MIPIAQWILWMLYGITSVFYLRDFLYKRGSDRTFAQRTIMTGLVLHALFWFYLTVDLRRIPIATLSEALNTFVFLSALIYWLLEKGLLTQLKADRSMGTFILPVLWLLLTLANATYQADEPIAEVLKDVRFEMHVLAMLLSYGAFTISFIASLLHVLLAREIKKRDLRLFYSRLPSLAFFDNISNRAVDIGLVFATIGFALGFYSAVKVWGSFLLADPKFLVTAFSWAIYFIHFLGRRVIGWSGRLVANLSIFGFSVILFSFIIISLLFSSLHRFI